jgi:hypothetical protein
LDDGLVGPKGSGGDVLVAASGAGEPPDSAEMILCREGAAVLVVADCFEKSTDWTLSTKGPALLAVVPESSLRGSTEGFATPLGPAVLAGGLSFEASVD